MGGELADREQEADTCGELKVLTNRSADIKAGAAEKRIYLFFLGAAAVAPPGASFGSGAVAARGPIPRSRIGPAPRRCGLDVSPTGWSTNLRLRRSVPGEVAGEVSGACMCFITPQRPLLVNLLPEVRLNFFPHNSVLCKFGLGTVV